MRIILVDDHLPVRDGLRRLLESHDDIEVVAEAGDGKEGARVARELMPTLVLMDGSMPVWDGLQATEAITVTCPAVKVIAVTRNDAPTFIRAMLRAGARGYVLKQNASTELVRAVRAVAGGHRYIDRSIQALDSPTAVGASMRQNAPDVALTDIEKDVLGLIAELHTTEEIADRLSMGIVEVLAAKTSAMQKTGLATRIQVMRYAQTNGWSQPRQRPSS